MRKVGITGLGVCLGFSLVLFWLISFDASLCAAEDGSRRTIVVGGDHDFPPFEYLKDGEPAGFNIDLLRAVAEIAGYDVKFHLGAWCMVRQALVTGEVDALAGLYYSRDRANEVDFSIFHNRMSFRLFVRNNSSIKTVNDLADRELVVQRGDIMHDEASRLVPKSKLILVNDAPDALRLLAVGKHDAVLMSRIQGLYLIEKYSIGGIHDLDVDADIHPRSYCFAVKKGNAELLRELNEALVAMKTSGRYRQLYDKWFGVYEEKSKDSFWTKFSYYFFLPLLGLLIVCFLWSRFLQYQVRAKTEDLSRELAERRKVQAALEDSEEKFRTISEHSLMAVEIVHRGRIVYANEAAIQICGYSFDELSRISAEKLMDTVHPDDVQNVINQRQPLLDGLADRAMFTFRTWTKSGRIIWLEMYTRKFLYGGEIAELVTFFDITDRKTAEEKLRKSEQNLSVTLDSIADAVITTDANGSILIMNPVACRLTGWGQKDSTGHLLDEVYRTLDYESRTPHVSVVKTILSREAQSGFVQKKLLLAGGEELVIEENASSIYTESGECLGVVVVFRDVTERDRLEAQLQQVQKMEAVGQLAGGIAHDFNNLVGGIVGYAELMQRKLGENDPLNRYVNSILDTAERAAQLTHNLLAFSRKESRKKQSFDMHRVIEQVADIVRHTVDRRISVELKLDAEFSLVDGDVSRIENAMMNLAVNARDAMAKGGELLFSTRCVDSGAEICRSMGAAKKAATYLEVCVVDTGVGMDQKTLSRVFEPFFTTKPIGQGTGIGLAMVYSTVKAHSGVVNVSSEPGAGATVRMLLPLGKEAVAEGEPSCSSGGIVKGEGTILLADDEEIARDTLRELLENMGYNVVVARDGEGAVDIFRKDWESFDLVILDMVMPGMNGRDAFLKMRDIDKDIKAVLLSGFTADVDPEELTRDGFCGILSKPCRSQMLSREVARCIGGNA